VCVCVREREGEGERELGRSELILVRKSLKERQFCRAEQSIFCCALHLLPLLGVGPCSLASVYKEAYLDKDSFTTNRDRASGGYGVRLSGLDSQCFFFLFFLLGLKL